MDKASTQSTTGQGGHSSAASGAKDRRRLARLALGAAILFLLPALYAMGRGGPEHYENRGSYALVMSAAPVGEDVRIPAGEVTPAAPAQQPAPRTGAAQTAKATGQAQPKHDQYYCDFYAQAVTGNVSPDQASRRQQTSGALAGAVGGAVLGALLGGSGGHSGRSSVLGASAGLLAGATMSSGYAQRAADEIRSRYAAAYSSCLAQGDEPAPKPAR